MGPQKHLISRWTPQAAVAYPGGFSGCLETPPPGHDFFSIRGFTSLHAPTFTSHLNLRLLETPLETNSGYATEQGFGCKHLRGLCWTGDIGDKLWMGCAPVNTKAAQDITDIAQQLQSDHVLAKEPDNNE